MAKRAADLLREQKELAPVVEAYRRYKAAEADLETAQELLRDEDPDIRDMAFMEVDDAKTRMADLEEELKILLLPKDVNDDKNVIVEIRGGVGGEEAALFAASLYRMYSMYAEKHRYKLEVMNINVCVSNKTSASTAPKTSDTVQEAKTP